MKQFALFFNFPYYYLKKLCIFYKGWVILWYGFIWDFEIVNVIKKSYVIMSG